MLSGCDISFPCRIKLWNSNDANAAYHDGPVFGGGFDLSM